MAEVASSFENMSGAGRGICTFLYFSKGNSLTGTSVYQWYQQTYLRYLKIRDS